MSLQITSSLCFIIIKSTIIRFLTNWSPMSHAAIHIRNKYPIVCSLNQINQFMQYYILEATNKFFEPAKDLSKSFSFLCYKFPIALSYDYPALFMLVLHGQILRIPQTLLTYTVNPFRCKESASL